MAGGRIVIPTGIRRGPVVPAYFHPAIAPAAWQVLAGAAGAVRLVVVNVASGPGHQPDQAYVDLDVPGWVHDRPAHQLFQLVYDCPPTSAATIARLAVERNVGSLYRTEGSGTNPWDALPGDYPGTRPATN